MSGDAQVWLAILVMGVISYGSRLSGYLLFSGYTPQGRMKAALDAVPSAVLMAVIAPNVFLNGPAEMAGGAAALVAALLRAPLLVTIAVGMGVVAALRFLL
jgi:uncharacterized membrane protein